MAEKKQSFEEKMSQLETITTNLEKGDVPLAQAMSDFQKGVELNKELEKELKSAEDVFAKIVNEDGSATPIDEDAK